MTRTLFYTKKLRARSETLGQNDPWAHDPEVCPSPDCPGCYAEAYVPRNVTSLSEDCPHCGSPLRPRCLCWQSGDDEN